MLTDKPMTGRELFLAWLLFAICGWTLMWCLSQKPDTADMIDKHEYSGLIDYNRGGN